MSAELQEFLATRLPLPGLVAWCARMPDRTVTSQSYADWLPAQRAEQILSRLVLATDGLRYHQLEALNSCWAFEHLSFRLGVRPDGVCLLLIERNAPEMPSEGGREILEDFAGLNVAANPEVATVTV